MSYKGKFFPRFPNKYKGDPTNIVYRSLLELKAMNYFDLHSSILQWASEEVVIPYYSPLDDGSRIHRYFVDFYIKYKTKAGLIKEALIEVKPFKHLSPPTFKLKKTRRFYTDMANFAVNQAKWAAAEALCEEKGWDFLKWTEKELRY